MPSPAEKVDFAKQKTDEESNVMRIIRRMISSSTASGPPSPLEKANKALVFG